MKEEAMSTFRSIPARREVCKPEDTKKTKQDDCKK